MRLSLFCTVLLAAVLPSTVILSAQTVTVPMHVCGRIGTVIPVMLNGSGPYDFLLDTGTTSMIVDAALFNQLGLHADGTAGLRSANGETRELHSILDNVSVGSLTVNHLEVVSASALFATECSTLRGIVGETFLQHFDLLLDNQHHSATLDAGQDLAASLGGEHLPVATSPTDGRAILYRPIVSVTMPEFGRHPLNVLLDSGASAMVIVQKFVSTQGSLDGMKTVNGRMRCSQSMSALDWGKSVSEVIPTHACEADAPSSPDHIGNLPTSLFHQIFISHANAYVIVNPSRHPIAQHQPGQEELAIAQPLPR